MGTINKITLPLVTLVILVSQSVVAGTTERNQAKRIHDRLTGVSATNAAIDDMERTLDCTLPELPGYLCDATGKSAAQYAIDTAANPNARYFYNVTLKNYAAPWTNEEQTVFTPLNDYTATVIGLIRDGEDFRRVLYDDVIYHANPTVDPDYSDSDNAHYVQLEAMNLDLSDQNILRADQQSNVTGIGQAFGPAATAGVMTSRAGSMAFFSDGTNRAMFRFTLMNHLCTDLEPLKDVTRTPDRVRRDVSRSPGGDSRIFLNGCVGCHAGMDGMAGAFAFYEWNYTDDKSDGSLGYTPGSVSGKHNINQNNFEFGHFTDNASWINYWRNGPNSKLGVRPADDSPTASGWGWNPPGAPALPSDVSVDPDNGNSFGTGARSLGIELSNTRAFAQCQVDKAFKSICLRDPNVLSADRSARDTFVTNFTGSGYNMREVFTDVAAYCKGS